MAKILAQPTPHTTPTNDQQVTIQDPHTIPEDTLECLESYLNIMSEAVANAATAGYLDIAEISSMAKSLDTLTLANRTLVREVASLRANLANSSSQTANSKLDGHFSKTGYCWLHGYKVSKTHTSESCTNRKDVHKEKSTRRKPMGGSDWNKGWGT